MKYIILRGVAPEKITLGLPTIGRAFELTDGNLNSIGSPTRDPSLVVAYSDVCKLLKSVNFTHVDNQRTRSTYHYNIERKRWISSDSIDQFAFKVIRFSTRLNVFRLIFVCLGDLRSIGRPSWCDTFIDRCR